MIRSLETHELVQFYDTDSGGVISNIAYLRYVERARAALFAEMGMPMDEMPETGRYPVVARSEIDYRTPGRLGENITVRANIETVEKVKISCTFSVVAERDGVQKELASCRQIVVLVQMPSGKPLRVPAQWRATESSSSWSGGEENPPGSEQV